MPHLISLLTPAGRRLFDSAVARDKCVALLAHFVTQETLTFCGPASVAMVLNALGVPRPESSAHAPHRLFTQGDLFAGPLGRIVPRRAVLKAGVSLATLGEIFRAHGLDARVTFAAELSLDAFRDAMRGAAARRNCFVVANYFRPALGQLGGGHLSPVGAYEQASDRLLLLDVSRYKYPPVWVRTAALWRSMRPVDATSSTSRGFVTVMPADARRAGPGRARPVTAPPPVPGPRG